MGDKLLLSTPGEGALVLCLVLLVVLLKIAPGDSGEKGDRPVVVSFTDFFSPFGPSEGETTVLLENWLALESNKELEESEEMFLREGTRWARHWR